jgi:hypothetical protein
MKWGLRTALTLAFMLTIAFGSVAPAYASHCTEWYVESQETWCEDGKTYTKTTYWRFCENSDHTSGYKETKTETTVQNGCMV